MPSVHSGHFQEISTLINAKLKEVDQLLGGHGPYSAILNVHVPDVVILPSKDGVGPGRMEFRESIRSQSNRRLRT